MIEQPEPHERPVTADPPGGERLEPGFERQSGLVGDIAGQSATVHFPRGIGLLQHAGDFLRAAGDEHVARALEQVRIDRALAAGVV